MDKYVILSSDLEYDKLVAEMYVDGLFIGLVQQELGSDNLIVELPGRNVHEAAVTRRASYEDLIYLLNLAKKKLLNREQEPNA